MTKPLGESINDIENDIVMCSTPYGVRESTLLYPELQPFRLYSGLFTLALLRSFVLNTILWITRFSTLISLW